MLALVSNGPQQGPARTVKVMLRGLSQPLCELDRYALSLEPSEEFDLLPEALGQALMDLHEKGLAIGVSTSGHQMVVAMAATNRDSRFDVGLVIGALVAAGVNARRVADDGSSA